MKGVPVALLDAEMEQDAGMLAPVALLGIEIGPVKVEVALPPKAEDEADAKGGTLELAKEEAEEITKLEATAELDGKAEPEKLGTNVLEGPGTLNEPTFELDAPGMEKDTDWPVAMDPVALEVSLWCPWGRQWSVRGSQSPHGSEKDVGKGSKEDKLAEGRRVGEAVVVAQCEIVTVVVLAKVSVEERAKEDEGVPLTNDVALAEDGAELATAVEVGRRDEEGTTVLKTDPVEAKTDVVAEPTYQESATCERMKDIVRRTYIPRSKCFQPDASPRVALTPRL